MGRKLKAMKMAEGKANENEKINVPVENTKDVQMTLASLPSKKQLSKNINRLLRRSARLRNKLYSGPNQDMRVEEIVVADSELEDKRNIEQFNSEPPSNQQSLEDKIDFLVQSVKEFQSQGTKRPFPSETDPGEPNYRSLYFISKKKIEALADEKRELVKELEFARGSVEAFQQIMGALGTLKDLAIINNLGRATEAIVNFSTQAAAAAGKFSLPEATNPDATTTPAAADGNKTAAPVSHKKYTRKKR